MGKDGFSIRRLWRERFVPWSEFEGFESTPRGIVAHTVGGRLPIGRARVVLDEGTKSPREQTQLDTLGKLYSAARDWREERPKPRVLQLLDGHPQAAWPAVLSRAVDGDFRTSGITQTHLRDDLLNPDTPPALREVLAKTLKVRIEEDVVEDAIEVFASERSKNALRSVIAKGE